MDKAKIRAWWFERQGLSGMPDSSPARVLAKAGWARSVGGANPYLMLFSRAGISRVNADKAVADVEIHELPSARNCTYVVPERDFAMALRMARGQGDPQEIATAKKYVGVTEKELVNLQAKVLDALGNETLDPKEIRDRVGDAVCSLGDEGKKRGMTTTLPMVLGLLQTEGNIRRVPIGGRLDQQRYKYAKWDPSPMTGYTKSLEETYEDFAHSYFSWTGPARKSTFKEISGLGVRAAEAAMAPLDLVPVGDELFILTEDRDAFEEFRAPKEPRYVLTSSLDNLSHLHWGIRDLIDEADFDLPAFGPKPGSRLGGLADLENHAIYDRGRLIGVWEFDSERGEIVWTTWVEPNSELISAVSRMEDFARDQLGDVRSFSLDSPESRKPKIDMIRNARQTAGIA